MKRERERGDGGQKEDRYGIINELSSTSIKDICQSLFCSFLLLFSLGRCCYLLTLRTTVIFTFLLIFIEKGLTCCRDLYVYLYVCVFERVLTTVIDNSQVRGGRDGMTGSTINFHGTSIKAKLWKEGGGAMVGKEAFNQRIINVVRVLLCVAGNQDEIRIESSSII